TKMFRLWGILLFCGLLAPSQGVPGLSCAVSPRAVQNVLSGAILRNGLLQQHLQNLLLPNIVGDGGLLNLHISITGLRLVKARFLDLSVMLLPGIGVQMSIATKLDLRGNCLMGLLSEVIDIVAEVSIGMNIKCTNYESGTVQVVVEDCLCIFGDLKLNLLSGLVSLSLSDLVHAQLTGTLPALVSPRAGVVWLCVAFYLLMLCCSFVLQAVIQIGTAGAIQYQLANTPFTTDSFLGLDLEAVVQQAGGGVIPYDSSPLALPPLRNKLLVVGVYQGFLNAALGLLIHRQVQAFACTPETFSGAKQLREAVTKLFPAGCSGCSRTAPLSIKIALSGSPRCSLEVNKATLRLSASVQLLSPRSDGSVLSLLLLRADLALRVRLSIAGGRLMLAVSLG
ncbi:BPIB4 protein, partial [Nothoprocta ornata]|nr:BPIB4 protein [Nothoprocta pentlandii]NWX95063.1 BPIB4 protein [Nothoprocta ornata]